MAIQLFNATATSLNCISQRCRFGQGRWQHPAAQRARKGQLSEPRHYQSSAGAGTTRYPDRPSRPAEAVACPNQRRSFQKRTGACCCSEKSTFTKNALIHARDVANLGKKTLLGNYSLTEEEFSKLKKQADHGYIVDVENRQLKQQLSAAQQNSINWQTRYRNLQNKVQPYLDAMRHAPERVRNFFENLLAQKPERTADAPSKASPRRTPNL